MNLTAASNTTCQECGEAVDASPSAVAVAAFHADQPTGDLKAWHRHCWHNGSSDYTTWLRSQATASGLANEVSAPMAAELVIVHDTNRLLAQMTRRDTESLAAAAAYYAPDGDPFAPDHGGFTVS